MTQRKSSRPRWSMFPSKHDSVTRLLALDGLQFTFHDLDDDVGCVKNYNTNIMGRFKCYNNKCSSDGWSSKQIAIYIRMYEGNEYNAQVYHQQCKACKFVGKPIVDDSYAERISYRLKKWSGIDQELPVFSEGSKGPHQNALCEGCKAGHCSRGNSNDDASRSFWTFQI